MLPSSDARWLESHIAVTRRHYKVVALCIEQRVSMVEQQLRDALPSNPIKSSVTRLADADEALRRVCFEFDADELQRNHLSQAVRHLCTMPGVRYVRLDPRSS